MQAGRINCSVAGCDKPVRSRGMCKAHYEKQRKYGNPLTQRNRLPLLQPLMGKVQKTDTCWFWTGAKTSDGYGQLLVEGKAQRAHRLSWEAHRGAIAAGMHVLHKREQPPCINPDLLLLGTNHDNVLDRESKGRNTTSRNAGSRNHSANLTQADADEIRANNQSQKELATKFGVSIALISAIRKNKLWRTVE